MVLPQRKTLPLVLLLGFAAFIYMSALTQGERLFDNDYDWISQAQSDWSEILQDIFRPMPRDWGFQNRPLQVLCFKMIYTFFGYDPGPYYAFKCFLFALVTCGICVFCLGLGFGRAVGFTSAAIFALSSPVFSSTLWVSDFELLAQLFILSAFSCFLFLENHRCFEENRVKFYLLQGFTLLFAILGHAAKGSAKIVPFVVLGFLLVYNRRHVKRHLLLVILILLTIVPLVQLLDDPIPPFAPFSEDQSNGWMWRPANLTTLHILIFGDVNILSGSDDFAYSLLGAFSPVLLWSLVVAAAFLFYIRRWPSAQSTQIRRSIVFCSIWLAVVIVSLSAFPRLPYEFMSRYVTVVLVPASVLTAIILVHAVALTPERVRRYAGGLLLLVILGHSIINFGHVRHTREYLGQIMISYDRARTSISETIQNATVFLLDYTFSYNRPLGDGNLYVKNRGWPHEADLSRPLYVLAHHDGDIENIDYDPVVKKISKPLQLLSNNGSQVRIGIRPIRVFHSLTDGFYDRWIYGRSESIMSVLFHVVLEPHDPQKALK